MYHYRVKPRKQHDNNKKYHYDSDLSGYVNLAMAVVHQAKNDAEHLQGKEVRYFQNEWIRKSELIHFFESAWCDTLLGHTNFTGLDIKEKLGL